MMPEIKLEAENPWNIQSIYELQYFNCPSCIFKDQSKQTFVNHAFEEHPEVVGFLHIIPDGSLSDVDFPMTDSKDLNLDQGQCYKSVLSSTVCFSSNLKTLFFLIAYKIGKTKNVLQNKTSELF